MCHVLIIEDEALIALDLADLLSSHGALSFSFAETEADAMAAADARAPDFILADVYLRAGYGPKAVSEIRRLHGLIPVIFVTANPHAQFPHPAPSSIFRKPLDRISIATAFRAMAFGK